MFDYVVDFGSIFSVIKKKKEGKETKTQNYIFCPHSSSLGLFRFEVTFFSIFFNYCNNLAKGLNVQLNN